MQDEFSTEATWHTAPEAVVAHFGEVAEAELGIPKERFLDAFGSPANDVATRITFKVCPSSPLYCLLKKEMCCCPPSSDPFSQTLP